MRRDEKKLKTAKKAEMEKQQWFKKYVLSEIEELKLLHPCNLKSLLVFVYTFQTGN